MEVICNLKDVFPPINRVHLDFWYYPKPGKKETSFSDFEKNHISQGGPSTRWNIIPNANCDYSHPNLRCIEPTMQIDHQKHKQISKNQKYFKRGLTIQIKSLISQRRIPSSYLRDIDNFCGCFLRHMSSRSWKSVNL